ncbi:hypothetical protein C8F01DRAFT_1252663 [Mycena amicta]|nr:hypothetical protein C8F01DRAFT_1252663 [Mycena amicta]
MPDLRYDATYPAPGPLAYAAPSCDYPVSPGSGSDRPSAMARSRFPGSVPNPTDALNLNDKPGDGQTEIVAPEAFSNESRASASLLALVGYRLLSMAKPPAKARMYARTEHGLPARLHIFTQPASSTHAQSKLSRNIALLRPLPQAFVQRIPRDTSVGLRPLPMVSYLATALSLPIPGIGVHAFVAFLQSGLPYLMYQANPALYS